MRLLEPGTELDGFVIGECVHSGGMAHIYRVTYAQQGRDPPFPLAMKVPRMTGGDGAETIVSFEVEHQMLQVLHGEHVPRFVAAGDLMRTPYLVMEYVQGQPLQHWIDAAANSRERPPADLFSGPWIAAVAVLLVAGAATWWWLDRPVEVNATPAAGVTAEGQADEPPVPRTEPAEDEPATAATPDAAMSAAAQSPPASEIAESESDPAGGPAADPSTTADTQAPPASAATGAAELQLELSYRGDCWTEVTDANGRRLYFGLGTDGRNISVSGVPPLRVLLGDNDNVSLMVDGRAYPVPASALRGNTARLMITGP